MTSETIEDFKAAFVCITSNPNGYFKSVEDLTRALQGCGKNPSPKKIDSYWRKYNRIDMDTFCEIALEESTITERELLEAFSYIDINKNGYISTKDFITLFTTSGDSISEYEARELVDEADLNKDGRINYREFSRFIIDTIEKAKRVARKKMNKIIAEKEMEKEIIRRSPSLKSESRYYDDYDNKILKKTRKHSIQNDSDMDRSESVRSRPSSGNLKRMLKNEFELTRENSHDSLRSTSKIKHHRNEYGYYDQEEETDERHKQRRPNEREHDRIDLNNRDRQDREHEFESKNEKNRHHSYNHHRKDADDLIRKKIYENYDEDRISGHSDRGERRIKDHSRDREQSHDRHLEHDYDTKSHRSRSRDKDRDYHDWDRESNLDKHIDKKKSPRSTKHSLFETKHKSFDRIHDNFQEPKHLKRWPNRTTKGAFYFNENINAITSNSFALDIQTETSVFFSIETFHTELHSNHELFDMDVCILIVKDNRKLALKGFTENKIKNKWCTRLDLSPGRYFLFPFTSGCHLKKREFDYTNKAVKFFEKDLNGKRTLSRKFKEALSVVFDLCDLDSNGRLSQEELNLYTYLTANENLSREEWLFVGETVGFEKNELNKEGFIKLSKIEAQREDTDLEDISARMTNLGFNKSLTIDQSCPYVINVSCETDQFDLLIGEIFSLKSAEKFLSQIIEAKGVSKPLKSLDGVLAFEYHNNYVSYLEIQNQSPDEIRLEIDCTESENVISNINHDLINSIRVKPLKNKLAMCLTAKNPNKDWVIKSKYSINLDQTTPRRNF